MISETNTQIVAGTVYVRIPPHMVAYLKLSKEKNEKIFIEDNANKKETEKSVSMWKNNENNE